MAAKLFKRKAEIAYELAALKQARKQAQQAKKAQRRKAKRATKAMMKAFDGLGLEDKEPCVTARSNIRKNRKKQLRKEKAASAATENREKVCVPPL